MASIKSAKRWLWWDKWSSLIRSLFLLLLCITGLPLVEIEYLSKREEIYNDSAENDWVSLDLILSNAHQVHPDKVTRHVFWDEENQMQYISAYQTH